RNDLGVKQRRTPGEKRRQYRTKNNGRVRRRCKSRKRSQRRRARLFFSSSSIHATAISTPTPCLDQLNTVDTRQSQHCEQQVSTRKVSPMGRLPNTAAD
ncbi:hypothetical protein GT037_005452, partial [Alternaria burnsii]